MIRQSLNRDELAAVETKAREANELIDRRAFSWTELLNQFQATLPPDVRITAVTPQVDREGKMLVAVSIVSKKLEDLEEFIEALEATGSFTGVLSRSDTLDEDGTLRSVLQGYYQLPAQPAAAAIPAPPASEPAKGKSAPAKGESEPRGKSETSEGETVRAPIRLPRCRSAGSSANIAVSWCRWRRS